MSKRYIFDSYISTISIVLTMIYLIIMIALILFRVCFEFVFGNKNRQILSETRQILQSDVVQSDEKFNAVAAKIGHFYAEG